jgi:chromosome segregation ATPase
MLTVNKLEKIIELEDKLRAEYQEKLDTANAEAERYKKELAEQREQLQATIDQQLESIQDLSGKATAGQQLEQRNRELTNRSENLQDEVTTLKQRVKALQKDLAKEREQVKVLTQFDPARMKKNLDANKKKLAEKTRANELLKNSLKEAKNEKIEQQIKLKELEEQLAELKAEPAPEEEAA